MLTKLVQEKIIDYCKSKQYKLSEQDGTVNIIYIEGMNRDGSINDDSPNIFNDLRTIFDSRLKCVAVWQGTTEPGRKYTLNPLNRKGAARIAFGQYYAWQVGWHKNHEALAQTGGKVLIHRDANKDFIRTGDDTEWGYFGINQHWGYDLSTTNIGAASAGCLVGRTRDGHREFMEIVKKDARYLNNEDYVFSSIILPGDQI